jgi:Concanavalin A-like lectin/glucanases superfamily
VAANIPNVTNATAILSVPYAGPATQIMTVMCWARCPVIGTPANFRDFVTIDPNIFMQLFSDGATFDFGTANNNHLGPVMQAGVWYHVCQVVVPTSTTSRQIYGYVNGQLRVNVTDGDTSTTFTAICIGNSVFSGFAFPLSGNVKDVKVWQRQLTPQEIIDEMNTKYPIHWQALQLWCPLDDSLYPDKSGHFDTLTVGSGVTLGAGPFKPFNPPHKRS